MIRPATLVALGLAAMCGDARASGARHRDPEVPRQFQRLHPCPSTGKTHGPCPGFVKDHIVPL